MAFAQLDLAGWSNRRRLPPMRSAGNGVLRRDRGVRRATFLFLAIQFVLIASMLDGRIAIAALTNRSDTVLDQAMACASTRQQANPCGVPACFEEYNKTTPPAQMSPAAKSAIADAETACRASRQRDDTVRPDAEREEKVLREARECAGKAVGDSRPCAVEACFTQYFREFGTNTTRGKIAAGEIANARTLCVAAPPPPSPPSGTVIADGTYNARAADAPGCGVRRQHGILVVVRASMLTWEHQFRGVIYKWSGSVDGAGVIRASVTGSTDFAANGRYSPEAREIIMRYPQCGQETITLSIIGMIETR